jgi:hypothetical protein
MERVVDPAIVSRSKAGDMRIVVYWDMQWNLIQALEYICGTCWCNGDETAKDRGWMLLWETRFVHLVADPFVPWVLSFHIMPLEKLVLCEALLALPSCLDQCSWAHEPVVLFLVSHCIIILVPCEVSYPFLWFWSEAKHPGLEFWNLFIPVWVALAPMQE